MRYGTTTIQSGVSTYNYVLNSITGNVAFLFAIIRQTGSTNGQPNDPNEYQPVLNFSILDSTSTNITGGQPVPLSLVQQYLSRKWTASSYYSDIRNVKGNFNDGNLLNDAFYTSYANDPSRYYESNSYAIMYSFCENPVEAVNSSVSSGAFRFFGSEQLQIQFSSATTVAQNMDVYAFVESALEVSPTYVKKLSL